MNGRYFSTIGVRIPLEEEALLHLCQLIDSMRGIEVEGLSVQSAVHWDACHHF